MTEALLDYGLSMPALTVAVELSLRCLAYGAAAFTIVFSFVSIYAARRFWLLQHESRRASAGSDIRVDEGFLRRIVAPLSDPQVGLVSCFYQAPSAANLGALLEAVSINAQFLPQALTAGFILGLRFAMGAAMLIRRNVFEAVG